MQPLVHIIFIALFLIFSPLRQEKTNIEIRYFIGSGDAAPFSFQYSIVLPVISPSIIVLKSEKGTIWGNLSIKTT